MNVRYKIVDQAGGEINIGHFTNGAKIPVAIQSVQFLSTGEPGVEDDMVITLEYLHGQKKALDYVPPSERNVRRPGDDILLA